MSTSRLPMASLADPALAGCLTYFNLNIVNAVEADQDLAGLPNDSVALPLGKAWEVETEDGACIGDADLVNPTQVQSRLSTASILHLLQRPDRLLGRNHAHSLVAPDPRGGIP